MMPDALEQVRQRVESAPIHEDPFPHIEIRQLLPPDAFAELSAAIPPLEYFRAAKSETKLDLDIAELDEHFSRAPQGSQAAWLEARDGLFRDTVAPILARRLEDGIRHSYAYVFGEEVADELLDSGLAPTQGRIMCRKPGYKLRPHSDSAHFAVTCLLYFSSARDLDTGALSLYRPERTPELRHASTYYAEKEEGIAAEAVKSIEVGENVFVAFVNGPRSLHGFHVDRKQADETFSRFVYQCHLRPRHFDLNELYGRFDAPARSRWERKVGRIRSESSDDVQSPAPRS